jgi:hypothetical protein
MEPLISRIISTLQIVWLKNTRHGYHSGSFRLVVANIDFQSRCIPVMKDRPDGAMLRASAGQPARANSPCHNSDTSGN